jgi:hypothetical protein
MLWIVDLPPPTSQPLYVHPRDSPFFKDMSNFLKQLTVPESAWQPWFSRTDFAKIDRNARLCISQFRATQTSSLAKSRLRPIKLLRRALAPVPRQALRLPRPRPRRSRARRGPAARRALRARVQYQLGRRSERRVAPHLLQLPPEHGDDGPAPAHYRAISESEPGREQFGGHRCRFVLSETTRLKRGRRMRSRSFARSEPGRPRLLIRWRGCQCASGRAC